jgi:hypothetical protein
LSPRVHIDIGGRSIMFRRRADPYRSRSLIGHERRCPHQRSNRTHGRRIRAYRRHRFLCMRGGTRTGGVFRNQWSPKGGKSKLET